MAFLESCCGCGLAVSSAVLGVYLLVAYSIAFAIELWWILESSVASPIPAYLLCVGYFVLLIFSALLLHGLSVKRTTFLLIWLFMMGVLLGPEAGLVLYLSIHYWRVTSMYGLIEITCWACRLIANSIGLLCVQSLHSVWREEKSVLLRLETLKASPIPNSAPGRVLNTSVLRSYKNAAYEQNEVSLKGRQVTSGIESYGCFRPSENGFTANGGDYEGNYIDERYAAGTELSEFNASSFDPTVIDARLENMPYLTVRKRPFRRPSKTVDERGINPETKSLVDFRDAEFLDCGKADYFKIHGFLEDLKNSDKPENDTNSLDRKIIKNKNLKILRRLSPFCSRKPLEVNIYQINPPKDLNDSDLDSQLNKVYRNRGMYAFDEKLKKVVYYPPELFKNSTKFRSRIDSYGSNQSRSSIDTDSEDLRHISDVAL